MVTIGQALGFGPQVMLETLHGFDPNNPEHVAALRYYVVHYGLLSFDEESGEGEDVTGVLWDELVARVQQDLEVVGACDRWNDPSQASNWDDEEAWQARDEAAPWYDDYAYCPGNFDWEPVELGPKDFGLSDLPSLPGWRREEGGLGYEPKYCRGGSTSRARSGYRMRWRHRQSWKNNNVRKQWQRHG